MTTHRERQASRFISTFTQLVETRTPRLRSGLTMAGAELQARGIIDLVSLAQDVPRLMLSREQVNEPCR